MDEKSDSRPATKKQRQFLNDLRVFHGIAPIKFEEPMELDAADEAIAKLVKERDKVLPVQLDTIDDVYYAHTYANPVGSEGRKSKAEISKGLIGVSQATATKRIKQDLSQVITEMENGSRKPERASDAQFKLMSGIVQFHPTVAKKTGIDKVDATVPVLRPKAMLMIQNAVDEGIAPKYVSRQMYFAERDRKQEAQAQAAERNKVQGERDLTR